MSFFENARKTLQLNIREYGMYIALFIIMAIFTITTNGVFISSRNISNLLNQTGYIAVLAVGMTLVIIIRHIDLSVGFLAGGGLFGLADLFARLGSGRLTTAAGLIDLALIGALWFVL